MRHLVDLQACQGWAYVVERSPSGIAKPGWIATEVGASCVFAYTLGSNVSSSSSSALVTSTPATFVDTSAEPPSPSDHGTSPSPSVALARNRIGLGFLKSYERMGIVRATCVHDCDCESLDIDAHTHNKFSPLDLQYITTTPRAHQAADGRGWRCGIRVTVLNQTSSGQHKFKLTALFLNKHGDDAYFGRCTLRSCSAPHTRITFWRPRSSCAQLWPNPNPDHDHDHDHDPV